MWNLGAVLWKIAILLITAELNFESKNPFAHMWHICWLSTTFPFYSIHFQLNTDFCFKFYVLYCKITRGVYSSRKSELFLSTKRCLQNPSPNSSPTSKLHMPPNQEPRSIFSTFFLVIVGGGGGGSITVPNAHFNTRGVSEGGCAPSEARKLCIFETGIVQFGEYFWAQIWSS